MKQFLLDQVAHAEKRVIAAAIANRALKTPRPSKFIDEIIEMLRVEQAKLTTPSGDRPRKHVENNACIERLPPNVK